MPKERGVIDAILKATRPEGMPLDERKRRDRLLLLAVLAGWFVPLFELAILTFVDRGMDFTSDSVLRMAFSVVLSLLVYFAPMLLAVLAFVALYGRAATKVARVFTIAACSVLLPFLAITPFVLLAWSSYALLSGLTSNWWDPILAILGLSAFEVLPALTVFLIISRSEFFRGNRKGDGGADLPVAVLPPLVDRTTASGGVEFSTPRIVPA